MILFGSRARGHALRASDYDFLVLKAGAYHPREVAAAIYRGLRGIHASVEVIVAAPEEAAERADIPWMVYAPALREGSVV